MKAIDKISRVVNLMNSSKNLSNEEFNNDSEVLEVYRMIHGEEKLNSVLNEKTDLHLNKFYSLTLQIENITKSADISSSELGKELKRIEDFYQRNWQLINLVDITIAKSEIEFAEKIISQLPDDDNGPSQYIGHRKVLKYFAETGNITDFKKRIKLSKPGKFPRNEIVELKLKMIQTYSEQNGVEKGLELSKSKLFGEKFMSAAIMWKAPLMTMNEIDETIEKYPVLIQKNPYILAELYTKHFFDSRITTITEEEFEKVTNEIDKIDFKIKRGDGKLRDNLFYDLGSSIINKSQIKECKKKIKSTFYKKELSYHIENIQKGIYDG